MLLLIKELTDIITSPVISVEQVHLLAFLIREYLELRVQEFEVPLKPKHHFMCHYPQLILWMGPLMSYCTLFCERKHCFFKRALRSTLNFKNVGKFCTEQHQFYQGFLNTTNARFDQQFLVEKFVESFDFLPVNVKTHLNEYKLLSDQNVYAEEAVYCGYNYKKGQFVFIKHDEYGEYFFVLQIQLLIYQKECNNILIYGERKAVLNIHERGLFLIQNECLTTEVININEFIDRVPLDSYSEGNNDYLYTKHTIPLLK